MESNSEQRGSEGSEERKGESDKSTKARKRTKKRKQTFHRTEGTSEKDVTVIHNDASQKNKKRKKDLSSHSTQTAKILNGIKLAISTYDQEKQNQRVNPNTESNINSYKSVMSDCLACGAQVTSQVHKRVYALICTKPAILRKTQRIRKALKLGIPLIDVSWVRDCMSEQTRIGFSSSSGEEKSKYLLNEYAKKLFENSDGAVKNNKILETQAETKYDGSPENDLTSKIKKVIEKYGTWSDPVDCGCCCVCHENGDDECKWCVSPPCDYHIKNKTFEKNKTEQCEIID